MARNRLIIAILILVLAVFGASCSRKAKSLDRDETERLVLAEVRGALPKPVTRVDCVEAIKRTKGSRIDCAATLRSKEHVRLRVVQLGNDHLDVQASDAFVAPKDATNTVAKALESTYGRPFVVDCGDGGLTVMRPGETFDCKAWDKDNHRVVTVEVTDAAGTLRVVIPKK